MEGEVVLPGFGGDDGVGYAVDDVVRVAATRKMALTAWMVFSLSVSSLICAESECCRMYMMTVCRTAYTKSMKAAKYQQGCRIAVCGEKT